MKNGRKEVHSLRPIQLKMTAFGPYKETETIDFTQLYDHQLFVISGATGSGKTTIFDAICFALYGTASGTDRDNNRMLRSQFADDATYTAVDFTFSIRDKTYRVFRQLPHIREGNRTETGAKYELYEIVANGEEIPAVDRQIVSEINEELESIIGLTKEQFQQIMMLPQGEFMKLLTSDTENKEKILRRIFKTEKYERLNELIREHVRSLQQRFETERSVIDREIQTMRSLLKDEEETPLKTLIMEENFTTAQLIHELENYTDTLTTQMKNKEKVYKDARKVYREKENELQRAKTVNDRFNELEEKVSELAKREKMAATYERKENILQAAERAHKVEPYETQYNDRKLELQEQETLLKTATEREKEAIYMYEQANKQYEKEKANETKRQQLHVKIERYKQLIPLVKQMEQTKQQIEQYNEREKRLQVKVEDLTKRIDELERAVNDITKDIAHKEQALETRAEKQARLYRLERQVEVAERFVTESNTYKKLHTSLEKVKEQFKEAEINVTEIERRWYADRAAVLAETLVDGDACPVCGSVHHPRKAERADEHITEADVDRCKKIYRKKLSELEQVRAQWDVVKEQVEKTTEQLKEMEIDRENICLFIKEAKADVQTLNTDLANLQEKEVALKRAKENRTNLEKSLQACQKELTEKNHTRNDLNVTRSQLEGQLQAEQTHIPDDVKQLAQLQRKIATMEAEYKAMVSAWEKSERTLQRTKETFTRAQTERKQLTTHVATLTEHKERAKVQFFEQLRAALFESVATYKNVKRTEEEIEQLRTEIEAYKEETATLRTQIATIKAELKDKERSNLDKLKEEVNILEKAYESALQHWNESHARKEKFQELTDELKTLNEQLVQLEKELATYTDLYDVVRGQNGKRISFERYVQIDYLEQIIAAANARFHSLTNGQFTLLRSDRQEARGRQSGLAFDVHDAYTGQARDVKTLSGGEKFIASLCLALGMSDVIQQFQGGISMDTIFIDEGFGHLDDESLQKAIDVLISLQKSGRMIGVISHVDTIKSLFPARIEVAKTKSGHSKAIVAVK